MFSFLFSVARSCANPFSVQPINTYGIVGQNVTLQCSITNDPLTIWNQPGVAGEVPVADSVSGVYPAFKNKYTLTKEENRYTLTLMNAVLTDGGQYSCYSPPHNSKACAEIIILGSVFVISF